MQKRRWLLPVLLACSATAVVSMNVSAVTADADDEPVLQCDSNLRVFGEAYYGGSEAGAKSATDATQSIVDGMAIPGGSELDVDVIDSAESTAVTTVAQPNGDVVAIVEVETTNDNGEWRVDSWEGCP